MTRVVLTGWRPGLQKVALVKAIRASCDVGLAAGKAHVDALLAGRTVSFEFANADHAHAFLRWAQSLGADGVLASRESCSPQE